MRKCFTGSLLSLVELYDNISKCISRINWTKLYTKLSIVLIFSVYLGKQLEGEVYWFIEVEEEILASKGS